MGHKGKRKQHQEICKAKPNISSTHYEVPFPSLDITKSTMVGLTRQTQSRYLTNGNDKRTEEGLIIVTGQDKTRQVGVPFRPIANPAWPF